MNYVSRRNFLKRSIQIAGGFQLFPCILPFIPSTTGTHPLKFIHRKSFVMGSFLQVCAYHNNKAECDQAITKVFQLFQKYEYFFSVFNPDSEISQINRHSGLKALPVNHDVLELFVHAVNFSKETNGIFDITIKPLMDLWGFYSQSRKPGYPSDKKIQKVLKSVGYQNIYIDSYNSEVGLLKRDTKIDMGGIGIGFAVDKAAAILVNDGIESALINHSGDIFAIGAPPNENGWSIGIVNPLYPDKTADSIKIKNEALCTSGNYRNYIYLGKKKIGHIINPKTGSSMNDLLSITTITKKCVEADVHSTTLFIDPYIPKRLNSRRISIQLDKDGKNILIKKS